MGDRTPSGLDVHTRLTYLVDLHFGTRSTMHIEDLVSVLEKELPALATQAREDALVQAMEECESERRACEKLCERFPKNAVHATGVLRRRVPASDPELARRRRQCRGDRAVKEPRTAPLNECPVDYPKEPVDGYEITWWTIQTHFHEVAGREIDSRNPLGSPTAYPRPPQGKATGRDG